MNSLRLRLKRFYFEIHNIKQQEVILFIEKKSYRGKSNSFIKSQRKNMIFISNATGLQSIQIQQYQSMNILILFITNALFLWQTNSLKIILYVSREEGPTCVYHYLNSGEKYSLTTKSQNLQTYRIDIYRQEQHQWEEVYRKDVDNAYNKISKMAGDQATHMFCFSNNQPQILKIGVEFLSGLQLGQVESLPTKNDHEMLDQHIAWMDKEKERLIEVLERIDNSDASNILKSSSGGRMVLLAVIGVFTVAFINYAFFRAAKKTLKDRKLI